MSVEVRHRPRSRASGEGGPAHPRRAGPRFRLARLDLKLSPYLYVAPFFLLFAVFGLWPLGYTFWVSLHDWDLGGATHTFIGFDNYRDLLADPYFWNAVVVTLGLFALATFPQLLIALWLAHLLSRRMRGSTFFRLAVLTPYITPVAAIAIVFFQLFARDYGLINYLVGLFGVDNIDWQANRWSSWIALAVMVDWRWTGYNALIYLAAMLAIPRDIYESAAIDGASQWRQFWRITVPLLRPTIVFTAIISTIYGLQLFVEPLLFDNNPNTATGGSLRQFQTVVMFMYENAFKRFDFGYSAAVAWLLFLLIVLISLANYAWIRRAFRGGGGGRGA